MTQVKAYERSRLAALHEYGLLDAPAGDELEAGHFVHVKAAGVDPAYEASPWVTGRLAAVRFYGSAPLITPQGYALGARCVFDDHPGELTDEQIASLRDLAGVILALFERRRQYRLNAQLYREAEVRQEFVDAVPETIDVAVVAADPRGHLSFFNRAGPDWPGRDADPAIDPRDFSDRYRLFQSDGVTPLAPDDIPLLHALHGGRVRAAEMVIRPAGRTEVRVSASGRALTASDGTPLGAVVAMTDVPADRAQRAALERVHAELAATIAEPQRSTTELERRVTVRAVRAGAEWVLTVADNRIGIPAGQRARDFEMFARVSSGGGATGHGVGLTPCQRIVERHGGRISAGETPGGGTTITVTLPAGA